MKSKNKPPMDIRFELINKATNRVECSYVIKVFGDEKDIVKMCKYHFKQQTRRIGVRNHNLYRYEWSRE